MSEDDRLLLDEDTRRELWRGVFEAVESYLEEIPDRRVAPELDPARLRDLLEPLDFDHALEPLEAVELAVDGLWRHQTHTPHPCYFGLFNPAATTMGIAADALVAAFNPQLAAWSHSPFAIEVERHLIRALGSRFGYDPGTTDGTFASGGAEANHTALLTALTDAFPRVGLEGVRGLDARPILYASGESHHSMLKAARLSGLGAEALREIPVDERLAMRPEALVSRIARDRDRGLAPFLVVATAGTTNSGAVDPIPEIADVTSREGLWLHLDAAWGGAAALVPEMRSLLRGAERTDSITFDAHKWLSVPMAAGLYLTRHPEILERTFSTANEYMPRESARLGVKDPYATSMQWSRRFIGLKVFLSLLVAGWDGYAAAIRHQTAMGRRLHEELEDHGWSVVNQPGRHGSEPGGPSGNLPGLPLLCFVDGEHPDGRSADYLEAVAGHVVASGDAWISTTRIGDGRPVLRACITNFRTRPEHLRTLIGALGRAREQVPVPSR